MNKILNLKEANLLVKKSKSIGQKVGLCCGGYDLLHPGHLRHFESAKKLCDVLVVAVTCDKYVAKRKGRGRPVFKEQDRAYMVANLSTVNFALISPYERAVELIEILQPDCYIKGPDYINNTEAGIVAERKAIESIGGSMLYTKDRKSSTTEIIKYIQERFPKKS